MSKYVKLIILSGLVICIYIPTFIWMVDRWTAAETYYSHGVLVPLISLFIVWHKRGELSKLNANPVKFGWVVFGVGIVIHVISSLWQVYFSSGFSLLLVIAGLVLIFLGKDFFKLLLFPIAFLAFMIPLPLVLISNLSFRLKIIASQLAVLIVNLLGMKAIRDGSIIRTAHSYLMVEDPCSGIRSLIALIALGTLMAFMSNLSRTKKWLFCAASIPIAILCNVIRIAILTLVSEVYGMKLATGKFHDVMGFLVFVFAFLGLMMVKKILE